MARFFLFSLFLTALFSRVASAEVQSTFEGPVKLYVWEHWQKSWNVERDDKQLPAFRLVRGFRKSGEAYLTLYALGLGETTKAAISCETLQKTSDWDVEPQPAVTYLATLQSGVFEISKATGCLDLDQKQIVTRILVQVTRADGREWKIELLPMYVRGKGQSYFNNPTQSYMAHAGKGQIYISGLMKAEHEKKWDLWNGILVKPELNFVDRNTMGAGAEIGLHRHVANQEAYLIESGKGTMVMGRAPFDGKSYTTRRKFDPSGTEKTVTEFVAEGEGSWIETRDLSPNQIAIIVPNPADAGDLEKQKPGKVYFHGFNAIEPTVFWTMGTKN